VALGQERGRGRGRRPLHGGRSGRGAALVPGDDEHADAAERAADPQAGQAARDELDWPAALPARLSGRPRLLSGYFGGYGSGFDAHAWSVGGRPPGLIGCDYADVPSSGLPVVTPRAPRSRSRRRRPAAW
jgi:hypothetical protein